MRNALVRIFLLAVLMTSPGIAIAQIAGPPHAFSVGQVADPDAVNENFNTVYQLALNRSGGSMSGLLVVQDVVSDAPGSRSLGSSSNRFHSLFLAGALNCSACVGPGVLANNSVTAMTIADQAVQDANIVAVSETKVTGSAVLARLAGTQTFTGTKTFTQTVTGNAFTASGGGFTASNGRFIGNGTQIFVGPSGSSPGTIFLRPNGVTSGTNDVEITSDGNVDVSANLTVAGSVMATAGGYTAGNGRYIGDGTSIFVGPSGSTAGTVFLRPNGVTSGTNQVSLTSAGVFSAPSFSGGWADGTVASPSLFFIQEPGTGLFRFGTNQVSVTTGGTERLRVTAISTIVQQGLTVNGSVVGFPNISTGTGQALEISATSGQVFRNTSSRRYKHDEQLAQPMGSRVLQLQPKTFRYHSQPDQRYLGFVAEDVAAVMPDAVHYDADGRPDSINHAALLAYLIAYLQEQAR